MANNFCFLRDFLPGVPLPSIQIDEESLGDYLKSPITAKFERTTSGKVIVRYPDLFGKESILSKVWFHQSILGNVTNDYLYGLEVLLSNMDSNPDRKIDDEAIPIGHEIYIVRNAKFPINVSFLPTANSVIIS